MPAALLLCPTLLCNVCIVFTAYFTYSLIRLEHILIISGFLLGYFTVFILCREMGPQPHFGKDPPSIFKEEWRYFL